MAEMTEDQRKIVGMLLMEPQSIQKFGMTYNPTSQQRLMDAANNLDFGKLHALGRLFGSEPSPNTRVSEDFGSLRASQPYVR